MTFPLFVFNLESDIRNSASIIHYDLITRNTETVSHRPSGKASANAINISRLEEVLNLARRMTHDSREPAASQLGHAVAISTAENAGSSHLMALYKHLSPASSAFCSPTPLGFFIYVCSPVSRFFKILHYTIF